MAHSDQRRMLSKLDQAAGVVIGGRYEHYKTKGIYVVEKLVILETNEQLAVAYYDETLPELTWIREYGDFMAQIDQSTPRFSLLS